MILIGGYRILEYRGGIGEDWLRPCLNSCGSGSIPSRGVSRRPHLGGTATVGYKQRLRIRLPLSNFRQINWPCSGVSDVVSTAVVVVAVVAVYPPA